MRNKNIFITSLLIILGFSVIYGVYLIKERNTEPKWYVKIESKGGFAPDVYYTYILISSNGTYYKYYPNGTLITKYVSAKALQSIESLLKEGELFKLEDEYVCTSRCPTDLPYTILSIYYNGNFKSISIYYPETLPEDIETLFTLISYMEKSL